MDKESTELAALDAAVKHYVAGRLEQAEAVVRRLLRKPDPGNQATLLLAKVLVDSRRAPQAVYELERALKLRPDDVELLMMLHNAYIASRNFDKAVEIGKKAFGINPTEETAAAIASLCLAESRLRDAEEWFETARQINPSSLKATMGLARVYSGTLRGAQTIAMLREGLKGEMRSLGMFRYLSFHLQYVSGTSPEELFEQQRMAGTLAAREADGFPPRLIVDPDPDRKITIGYLSPDFRQHACAHFMEPLFSARDRSAFRVIAYSASIYQDAVTQRFKKSADVWREVATLQDPVLVRQIADDKVDIAVDMAGHTSGTRLSALVLRPAPITATYLGYPASTGTPGVDFRLVDSITDPPGAEAFATEKLIRLDPCFLCFRPLADAPAVSEAPFKKAGHITFGSFNAIDKISEATLDAWSGLLKRVPGSRFCLKGRALLEESVASRVRSAFAGRGVDPGRLDLLGPTGSLRDHLDAYRRVDVAVDTFPYNGTTTTCEAMWMGVPVVALRGKVHASRVGASLLSAVGLPELVAESEDQYLEIAASLAADPDRLSALRSGLRQRMTASALCDEKAFVGRFEGALRSLWRSWCATQKAR